MTKPSAAEQVDRMTVLETTTKHNQRRGDDDAEVAAARVTWKSLVHERGSPREAKEDSNM
jgi:hypothetical protein